MPLAFQSQGLCLLQLLLIARVPIQIVAHQLSTRSRRMHAHDLAQHDHGSGVVVRDQIYLHVPQLTCLHFEYPNHFQQLWCRLRHQSHGSRKQESHLQVLLQTSGHVQHGCVLLEQVASNEVLSDQYSQPGCVNRRFGHHVTILDVLLQQSALLQQDPHR